MTDTLPPDSYERINAAMAAGAEASGIWLEPFTDEEQCEIEGDAVRSAEVLCCDLPRPEQVNEQVHRRLALELRDTHDAFTPVERKVIHSLGYLKDRLPFDRSSRNQQADRLQILDRSWRVGTKILVLYAGNPRFVAPIEDLAEWRHVIALLRGLVPKGDPLPPQACDVRISTRCKPKHVRVIHFKNGQYLCFHRACDRCVDWLMYDYGAADKKRLAALMAYE